MLLPARNRRDFEEIPEPAREALEFVWVDDVEQVLAAVFEEAARPVVVPAAVSRTHAPRAARVSNRRRDRM